MEERHDREHVSFSQLVAALRMLARNDFSQPLLVSYLTRRATAFERAFEPFSLKRTGFQPGYATVDESPKNEIEFWGNLSGLIPGLRVTVKCRV